MSDSVRPHRRQPTGLPHPWDSPGKNTGVGCHFLLQCMKVKSQSEVAQTCLTPSDPMDCSLPGPSIHGIFQGRVLEWVAIAFSELCLYVGIIIFIYYLNIFTTYSFTQISANSSSTNSLDYLSFYLYSYYVFSLTNHTCTNSKASLL